jgi:hypothetical protein
VVVVVVVVVVVIALFDIRTSRTDFPTYTQVETFMQI